MCHEENIHITEQVFVAAYEMHWKELYLSCCRYVGDTEQAKGIVQELFVRIWEKRATLVIRTSMRAYLFGALKLKTLEYYRKQAVRDQYLAYKERLLEESEVHGTVEDILFNDLKRRLDEVVRGLPKRSREVYELSREQGMDNKSIAKALLISEKAVEGNITRALAFIRQRMRSLLDG